MSLLNLIKFVEFNEKCDPISNFFYRFVAYMGYKIRSKIRSKIARILNKAVSKVPEQDTSSRLLSTG